MVRIQAKNAYIDIANIYFNGLVISSLIDLANNQGHDSTDVDSLYKFSQMARVLIHLIFGHLTPMVLAVLNGCLSRTVLTLIHLKRASKC